MTAAEYQKAVAAAAEYQDALAAGEAQEWTLDGSKEAMAAA